MSWKSAPNEECLDGNISSLMKKLLSISPICVFALLKKAAHKVNTEHSGCNYSKKHDTDLLII